MSTQIQGEYDEVWDTLKREMRPNLTGATIAWCSPPSSWGRWSPDSRVRLTLAHLALDVVQVSIHLGDAGENASRRYEPFEMTIDGEWLGDRPASTT